MFVYVSILINRDITTLKLRDLLTTVTIIAKILNSNRGTFPRLISVKKGEGKKKHFVIKKSHFSQKAIVQIKNL